MGNVPLFFVPFSTALRGSLAARYATNLTQSKLRTNRMVRPNPLGRGSFADPFEYRPVHPGMEILRQVAFAGFSLVIR